MRSELTKHFTEEELKDWETFVENATEEELKLALAEVDVDKMGFYGSSATVMEPDTDDFSYLNETDEDEESVLKDLDEMFADEQEPLEVEEQLTQTEDEIYSIDKVVKKAINELSSIGSNTSEATKEVKSISKYEYQLEEEQPIVELQNPIQTQEVEKEETVKYKEKYVVSRDGLVALAEAEQAAQEALDKLKTLIDNITQE